MEPTTGKCFGCRGLVAVVPEHHVVAAEHDLTHGLAVGGDVIHLGIDNASIFGLHHADSLTREKCGALGLRLVVPGFLVFADRVGAVYLGEAVDVNDG